MKADQERVRELLTDTVTLLCKNGLNFTTKLRIEGVLGITLDESDVFIVHINESIGSTVTPEISNSVMPDSQNNQIQTSTNADNDKFQSCKADHPEKILRKKHSPSKLVVSNNIHDNNSPKNSFNLSAEFSKDDNETVIASKDRTLRAEGNASCTSEARKLCDKSNDITVKTEVDLTADDSSSENTKCRITETTSEELFQVGQSNSQYLVQTPSQFSETKMPKRQVFRNSSVMRTHSSRMQSASAHQYSNKSLNNRDTSRQEENDYDNGESSSMRDSEDWHSAGISGFDEDMHALGLPENENIWTGLPQMSALAPYVTPGTQRRHEDLEASPELYEALYARGRRSSALHTLKPYTCPHAGCNLRFYHRNNVSRHCKLKHGGYGVKQRVHISGGKDHALIGSDQQEMSEDNLNDFI